MIEPPSGFLNIHKPSGPSSHDIIAQFRRASGIRRVGHTGTLDPLASGVLPLCIGRATRLSEYLLRSDKRYRARIHLGIATNTYDKEGEITCRAEISGISRDDVMAALAPFRGPIAQQAPRFSAIKRQGRKLYERARAGETFTPPIRQVFIHELTLREWRPPELELEVCCSAGTYIRSLAHDLGEALATGAHLSALMRTASGPFCIADALPLERILSSGNWQSQLLPPQWPFASWPKICLNGTDAATIRNGGRIERQCATPAGKLALAMHEGQLIAIITAREESWQPVKVLLPAGG